MKIDSLFYGMLAGVLAFVRRPRVRDAAVGPRILVIRRNRMGDMICTLPLLHALRRKFPSAHLAVACDAPGLPIAQSCSAVDDVILLKSGWNRRLAILQSASALQDYDWVIAAKVGFDQRLAVLTRFTNAPRRVGYETTRHSSFYTDPIAIPADLEKIHQIEATLGLLAPFGITAPPNPAADLKLALPQSAIDFVQTLLATEPLARTKRIALINLSSTKDLKFSDEDFRAVIADLLTYPGMAVGLVGLAADLPRARRLAARAGHGAVTLATPGPLELAALLQMASVFVTSEGGAAHLAAAVGTPTVVLWSEGPFKKWYSRADNHTFLQHEPGEKTISHERVRKALAGHLSS